MCHGLFGHNLLLGSLVDQFFKLFSVLNSLLSFLLSFQLFKKGCLFHLLLHILIALLPVKTCLLSRLVQLIAHLYLVLWLESHGHRPLDVLIDFSLTHVLSRLSFHIVEVQWAFLASNFPLLFQMGHLILEEVLHGSVFAMVLDLVSLFFYAIPACVIIDDPSPEFVLLGLYFYSRWVDN